MNRYWAEHKNYILAVAGGLFLFLMTESWVLGVLAETSRLHTDSRDLSSQLVERAESLVEEESLERGRGLALNERRLPALRARLEQVPALRDTVPEGEQNELFFLRKRIGETAQELEEAARRINLRYPADLGFKGDLSGVEVRDGLRQLAAIREIVQRAVITRLEEVEDDVRLLPPRVSTVADGLYVVEHRVSLHLRGDWEPLQALLASLSAGKPFVTVSEAEIETGPRGLRAQLVLGVLEVRQGPLTGGAASAASQAQGAGHGGTGNAGNSNGEAGHGGEAPLGPKPIRTYRPR